MAGKKRTVKPGELVDDVYDLAGAAAAVRMSVPTIRAAIRNRELEATIPRGRDPLRAGPGLGYRITREALTRWYFGGGQS